MVYVTAVKNLVDKKGTLGRRWYRNKKKKKRKEGSGKVEEGRRSGEKEIERIGGRTDSDKKLFGER